MRHALVTTLAGLMLAAGSARAQSTDRWLVLFNGEPTLSLDTTTITKSADALPRTWIRMSFKTPSVQYGKEVSQVMWRVDFNCAKRQIREVQTIKTNATGALVESSATYPSGAMEDLTPDGIGEIALNAFCKTPFARL